jgi:hypothetical protein
MVSILFERSFGLCDRRAKPRVVAGSFKPVTKHCAKNGVIFYNKDRFFHAANVAVSSDILNGIVFLNSAIKTYNRFYLDGNFGFSYLCVPQKKTGYSHYIDSAI